jgi:hypothetical protein
MTGRAKDNNARFGSYTETQKLDSEKSGIELK